MFTSILLLWAVISAVFALIVYLAVSWVRKNNVRTLWYDWLLAGLSISVFFFSIQNMYGSWMEHYTKGGWMFLLFPGVPALVVLGIVIAQIFRRNKVTTKA